MNGRQRKKELLELLLSSDSPLRGRHLAQTLHVSRQVIVNDIAHLRAAGHPIVSTAAGYQLFFERDRRPTRVFIVCHNEDQIEDELQTIVDLGGEVVDVVVEHDVYGPIQKPLAISSRLDVALFVDHMKQKKTRPLLDLTGGFHAHTIRAQNTDILGAIEKKLKEKGYLVKAKTGLDHNQPSQASDL